MRVVASPEGPWRVPMVAASPEGPWRVASSGLWVFVGFLLFFLGFSVFLLVFVGFLVYSNGQPAVANRYKMGPRPLKTVGICDHHN